jgi:hypothetical protein
MAPPTKNDRDALDRKLGRAVRTVRRPRGVPAPGQGEPSDDELLRVVEGVADAAERARVAAAEKTSAYTRDRLAVLREAMAETGFAPSAAVRAARYVFVLAKDAMELLRAATEPVALPAMAAVRSGTSTGVRAGTYEFVQPFDGVEAHLLIEHVTRADKSASIDVQLRLRGGGRGARVSLWRGGEMLDSVPVDEGDAAVFSGLGQSRYQIEVRRAGQDEALGKVELDFLKS